MINKPSNKIAILFIGLPGSGKTTQALFLAERLGPTHLTTSKIIREKFRNTPIGEDKKIDEERRRYDAGHIVDPRLVGFWVNEVVNKEFDSGNGVILDGSPRSINEAKLILPTLIKLYGEENVFPIYLDIDPEISFHRTSSRFICSKCEKSYPDSINLRNCKDRSCEGELIRKDLDSPEVFQKRLEVFQDQTQGAIDFFKSENTLFTISGAQGIENVFQEIQKVIEAVK